MNLRGLGIALSVACCGASAAKADWEYTKWGMTPQQVVSASKNLAKENSDPADLSPDSNGNVSKLVGPFKSGKFLFEARFGFDRADKLASVTLLVLDPKSGAHIHALMHGDDPEAHEQSSMGVCHDLDVAVNFAYGEPIYGGANHLYSIERWRDEKAKNDVDFHALFEVGCYVQYRAMK